MSHKEVINTLDSILSNNDLPLTSEQKNAIHKALSIVRCDSYLDKYLDAYAEAVDDENVLKGINVAREHLQWSLADWEDWIGLGGDLA